MSGRFHWGIYRALLFPRNGCGLAANFCRERLPRQAKSVEDGCISVSRPKQTCRHDSIRVGGGNKVLLRSASPGNPWLDEAFVESARLSELSREHRKPAGRPA